MATVCVFVACWTRLGIFSYPKGTAADSIFPGSIQCTRKLGGIHFLFGDGVDPDRGRKSPPGFLSLSVGYGVGIPKAFLPGEEGQERLSKRSIFFAYSCL